MAEQEEAKEYPKNTPPNLEEVDDDDDFFGSQQDDTDDFGALAQHETLAKERDLAAIGYFESYDENKDERLQDGFEAGYRQTFDVSTRIGEIFGQMIAHAEFEDNDKALEQSSRISQRLHDFLTAFQNGANDPNVNVMESIAGLEDEMLKASIE
jgi:hypothetical protein